MKLTQLLALLALGLLAGCSSEQFSSDIRTVAVNSTPRRPVVLLAPHNSDAFSEMANRQHGWLQNHLRDAINRQLAQSGRFQATRDDRADGEIAFDNLRHGLLEVSAHNYVVTVNAELTIYSNDTSRSWRNRTARQRTNSNRVVGHRELNSTAGYLHSLEEFENPGTYQESLDSAVDKLALELVHGL